MSLCLCYIVILIKKIDYTGQIDISVSYFCEGNKNETKSIQSSFKYKIIILIAQVCFCKGLND